MISNKHVVLNGRASFYATILEDIKIAAYDCGWAIGIHGSLNHDMDLMAMAWTEEATTPHVLMKAIKECFVDSKNIPLIYLEKPNHRIVYTLNIWSDWYLDINIIDVNKKEKI